MKAEKDELAGVGSQTKAINTLQKEFAQLEEENKDLKENI
jgi:cell division protein FtsB